MTQPAHAAPHADRVARWRDAVQQKLMAALDRAWAVIDTDPDPAKVRAARDKAKACGELAACVRKVASLSLARPTGARKAALSVGEDEVMAAEIEAAAMVAEVVGALPVEGPRVRKLRRGGGRGRGRL
ncbi:hypothetical protein [Caulobacter sp. 1776]|uniref:hypothetical protein n=1 Tax=Caulobacter sp. 1776 TaxID=3156420 RepID=UPI00339A2F74